MPAQEEFFKKEILSKYEKDNNCKVNVYSYPTPDSLVSYLNKLDSIDLVKVPFEKTAELTNKGLVYKLPDITDAEHIKNIEDNYFLLKLTSADGRPVYIPRKFETRVMIYLKSKVNEALEGWLTYKNEINTLLKTMNGYGLPAEYQMEKDLEKWDYYDILICGYYWMKTDSLGNGKIAHRGKNYAGTAQRIMDRAFQFGALRDEITTLSGDPIVQSFLWETVYSQTGIYNKKMWEDKWSGSGVWKGFAEGDAYLSFMTQLDCFYIHGTYDGMLKNFAPDPEDLGFTTIPTAVSFELDENGNYKSKGSKAISTGGWWWGIPKSSSQPSRGLELAEFITNSDNQVKGCESFGMIPVRKDILSNIALLFGKDWISDLYDVSFKQIVENRYSRVPSSDKFAEIVKIYIDALYRLSVDGEGMDGKVPSKQKIDEILENEFRNKLF